MHAVHTAIVGGSAPGLARQMLENRGLIDFVILEHAEHIGQNGAITTSACILHQ